MNKLHDKHFTLICYRSGYGGDFLCALIDEALGNSKFQTRDANNRYWFDNYVFSSCSRQIKSLHHIFSYYYGLDSVQVIDKLLGKAEWVDEIKTIYDMCFDDNELYFMENVTQHITSNLNLPHRFNVGNLHYMGEFPAFDVSKIFDPMRVITLKTESDLYFQYFHSFSQIKTNFKVLKRARVMKKEVFDCEAIKNSVTIDSGKLFFEDTLDLTISDTLSDIVGTKITVDLDELKIYRKENDKVLKRYFGENYKSLDAASFREKKLQLFSKVASGEDN